MAFAGIWYEYSYECHQRLAYVIRLELAFMNLPGYRTIHVAVVVKVLLGGFPWQCCRRHSASIGANEPT
eukprot:scaffold414366_cov24-Prasinocladus_malaysianus.AAC.1